MCGIAGIVSSSKNIDIEQSNVKSFKQLIKSQLSIQKAQFSKTSMIEHIKSKNIQHIYLISILYSY